MHRDRDRTLPSFSVVVPTHGRPRQLGACLAALAGLDYPREQFEVIVVDDGSPTPLDGAVADYRSRLRLTLLRQTNRGPAAARNAGAARAGGTFLAFTDDDCTPEPGWLTAFARHLARVPDCLLGGRTLNALPHNPFSATSQELLDYLYGYFASARCLSPFFTSNNLALPTARFRAIGGFDERFPLAAGEDRDLCERWHERGWPIAGVETAVVRHAHDLSFRRFCRQHFNYGRGGAYVQRARARRGVSGLRPEPLRFYVDMLRYPFRHGSRGPATFRAGLTALSQLANATGFFWDQAEHSIRHREGRHRYWLP